MAGRTYAENRPYLLPVKRTSERERLTDELRKLCDTTSEAYRDKDGRMRRSMLACSRP